MCYYLLRKVILYICKIRPNVMRFDFNFGKSYNVTKFWLQNLEFEVSITYTKFVRVSHLILYTFFSLLCLLIFFYTSKCLYFFKIENSFKLFSNNIHNFKHHYYFWTYIYSQSKSFIYFIRPQIFILILFNFLILYVLIHIKEIMGFIRI